MPGFPFWTENVARQLPVFAGYADLTTWSTAGFNAGTLWRLPNDIVYNTVTGDADFDLSGKIDSVSEIAALRVESDELANMPDWKANRVVNILYQILRRFRAARLKFDVREVPVDPYGTTALTTTARIVGVPTGQDTPNDTLVPVPSGRGVGSFQQKVLASGGFEWYTLLAANHASVGGQDIAGGPSLPFAVADMIILAERNNGDLFGCE